MPRLPRVRIGGGKRATKRSCVCPCVVCPLMCVSWRKWQEKLCSPLHSSPTNHNGRFKPPEPDDSRLARKISRIPPIPLTLSLFCPPLSSLFFLFAVLAHFRVYKLYIAVSNFFRLRSWTNLRNLKREKLLLWKCNFCRNKIVLCLLLSFPPIFKIVVVFELHRLFTFFLKMNMWKRASGLVVSHGEFRYQSLSSKMCAFNSPWVCWGHVMLTDGNSPPTLAVQLVFDHIAMYENMHCSTCQKIKINLKHSHLFT